MKCWVFDRSHVARIAVNVSILASLTAAPASLMARAGGAQGKNIADIYKDKCAVCHGDDGAGKTAKGRKIKVKDVRETIKKVTVEQMIEVVAKGKGPDMDAFGKEFTPDQIQQLVTYYRDLAVK